MIIALKGRDIAVARMRRCRVRAWRKRGGERVRLAGVGPTEHASPLPRLRDWTKRLKVLPRLQSVSGYDDEALKGRDIPGRGEAPVFGREQ